MFLVYVDKTRVLEGQWAKSINYPEELKPKDQQRGNAIVMHHGVITS